MFFKIFMYTFLINDFLNKIRNRPNWVAILFWNGSIILFFHQLIESHVMRNAGTIAFPGLRSNGKVLKLLKSNAMQCSMNVSRDFKSYFESQAVMDSCNYRCLSL